MLKSYDLTIFSELYNNVSLVLLLFVTDRNHDLYVFSHVSAGGGFIDDKAGLSVILSLCLGLKYLNNYRMDCHDIIVVHVPREGIITLAIH